MRRRHRQPGNKVKHDPAERAAERRAEEHRGREHAPRRARSESEAGLSKVPGYEYMKQAGASVLGIGETADYPVVLAWRIGVQTDVLGENLVAVFIPKRRLRMQGPLTGPFHRTHRAVFGRNPGVDGAAKWVTLEGAVERAYQRSCNFVLHADHPGYPAHIRLGARSCPRIQAGGGLAVRSEKSRATGSALFD